MAERQSAEAGIREALADMALIGGDDVPAVTLIGATPDRKTFKVEAGSRTFRVRWSDTDTCAGEHAFAMVAARHAPQLQPRLLGYDAARGVLVQEWLAPEAYKSLASALLVDEPGSTYWCPAYPDDNDDPHVFVDDPLTAIGKALGRIHNATAESSEIASLQRAQGSYWTALGNDYWRIAQSAQPRLAARLIAIAERSAGTEKVVVHGALSLQSILLIGNKVAIVDAEQAALGDPASDLAHVMAHLFLASVHRESCLLLTEVGSLHQSYAQAIANLDKLSVMFRAGPLCAALLLAFVQIDELTSYLSAARRAEVANFAAWWLERRDYTIGQVRSALWTAIDMGFNDTLIDWRKEFQFVPLATD